MALDLLFDQGNLVSSFAYKASGQSPSTAPAPSVFLSDLKALRLFAPADNAAWPGAPGRVGLTIPEPGGLPSAGVFRLRYTQAQTSGVVGTSKIYKIVTFVPGDNFTNIGAASNATGVIFTASGTTPTTWTNGSTLHEVTADLSYAATAAQMQTALNAMTKPGVTFTVTGDPAGPWSAVAGTTTVLSAFVVEESNLYPQSNGFVRRVQQGDGLNKYEQIRVSLKQAALTLTASFTTITAGAADISPLQAGVVSPAANAIHSIGLTSYPYGGFFTLTYSTGATGTLTTIPIAIGSTAATVQAAIITAVGGSGTAIVVQVRPNYYRVEYVGTKAATVITVPTMTISGVTFASGRSVSLDLGTVNMVEYLEGQASATAILEIEMDGPDTMLHVPMLIVNDGLDAETTSSTATDDPVLDSNIGYTVPAWRYDITALTGGTADALDAVATVNKSAGYRIDILIGGTSEDHYLLTAATTAEAFPGIIRPDDYAGGTNEKVWVQIS